MQIYVYNCFKKFIIKSLVAILIFIELSIFYCKTIINFIYSKLLSNIFAITIVVNNQKFLEISTTNN